MKKYIVSALILSILFSVNTFAEEAVMSNSMKITINNEDFTPKDSETKKILKPIVYNSSTYIPLRSISEAIGAKVDYDTQTKAINITLNEFKQPESGSSIYGGADRKIDIIENKDSIITVNGKNLNIYPVVYENRTYIPLRAAAEALGLGVSYDAQTKKINLVSSISSTENNDYETSLDLVQLQGEENAEYIVEMSTSMGTMKFVLYPQYAPKAVENFTELAKTDYYDNLTFHRVINEFVIQGGDPKGNGTGGESIWNEPFEDEITPNLRHFRGALAMANSGPNTNTSQFYIVQNTSIDEQYRENFEYALVHQNEVIGQDEIGNDILMKEYYPTEVLEKYLNDGGTPYLDGSYTIFGQLVDGFEVLDKIAAVETDEADKPVEAVIINDVNVIIAN